MIFLDVGVLTIDCLEEKKMKKTNRGSLMPFI